MKLLIKLTGLLFFLLAIFSDLHAQQKHFIYIQSQDKQPFAVVLNGKVYSSSDDGYVIVPKLIDGTYDFTVSFPMNKYPEQSFECVISKKDLGFKLQNTSEQGWALQNMQTQKILANNNTQAAANSAFSDMLSEVVSDSNLTKKNIASVEPSPDNSNALAGVAIAGSVVAASTDSSGDVGFVTDSIAQLEKISDSLAQLEKISESQLDTGVAMVFVDNTGVGSDTINVFVPKDSVNNVSSENTASNEEVDTSAVQQQTDITNSSAADEMLKTGAVVSATTVLPDTNPADITNPFYKAADSSAQVNENTAEKAAIVTETGQPVKTPEVTTMVKEDCPTMISDNDFDKLKRKMFIRDNNNDMIQAAVKSLGDKCIMTEQVKALGNLFSSDDGRYNLYEALYNNVYDYGRFPLLESQILEPYYKKRFEAMLR